ncbi:MAG: sugar ABC transporter permease, partial [Clostridia bacterium]|nr:sugar ABC transporter permease [Clostridia bacterium]
MKIGQEKQSRRRVGEYVFYVSIVLLPVIQFLIFYVLVNFNSIRLSFSSYDIETDSYVFSGFNNFAYIINNFSLLNLNISTKGSLLFYVFGLLIGTPLSLFFSFYICKKMRGYGFFRVFLFLPQIISSII